MSELSRDALLAVVRDVWDRHDPVPEHLVATMQAEGMDYPLHLGVTEAGSGEDGRIKSAVGIGALLADGLGDTIRVSLTEDPEAEVPVAALLRDYVSGRAGHAPIAPVVGFSYSPYAYQQRQSHPVGHFGGGQTAGLVPDVLLSTWHLHPFGPGSDFLVAILRPV